MQGLLEPISVLGLLDMFAWCFGDPRGLRSSRLWDVDKFKVPRASSVLLTPNSSAQEALDIVAGPRMPIRTSGLWLRLSGEGLSIQRNINGRLWPNAGEPNPKRRKSLSVM